MKFTLITSILLLSLSAFAGKGEGRDLYKRMNPWQLVLNEKDNDVPKGKAIFKVTVQAPNTVMSLKKKGDEEWKEMWKSDSAGAQFHVTLDTGRYDISFVRKGEYYPTTNTIELKNRHFYEARVYIHRIRRIRTKKPAIYLYSDEETELNLDFEANGNVNFVYPQKPAAGWNIETQANGKIKVDGKMYDYLFWEGDRPVPTIDRSLGFNVASNEVVPFLEAQLSDMGLNARETQDFIAYWGPQLTKNNLNFVQFMVGEAYNEHIATIQSDKNIDTEIRVFMVYESIEAPLPVIEQSFEAPERTGLTLVEWGGGELPTLELEN